MKTIFVVCLFFGIMFLLQELHVALDIKTVHWYDEIHYDDEGDIVEYADTTVWFAGFYIAIITAIRVYVMVVAKTMSLKKFKNVIHEIPQNKYDFNWKSLYWNLVVGFIVYGIIGYFLDEKIFGYEEGYHQILARILNLGLFVYICYLAYSKSKYKIDKD